MSRAWWSSSWGRPSGSDDAGADRSLAVTQPRAAGGALFGASGTRPTREAGADRSAPRAALRYATGLPNATSTPYDRADVASRLVPVALEPHRQRRAPSAHPA